MIDRVLLKSPAQRQGLPQQYRDGVEFCSSLDEMFDDLYYSRGKRFSRMVFFKKEIKLELKEHGPDRLVKYLEDHSDRADVLIFLDPDNGVEVYDDYLKGVIFDLDNAGIVPAPTKATIPELEALLKSTFKDIQARKAALFSSSLTVSEPEQVKEESFDEEKTPDLNLDEGIEEDFNSPLPSLEDSLSEWGSSEEDQESDQVEEDPWSEAPSEDIDDWGIDESSSDADDDNDEDESDDWLDPEDDEDDWGDSESSDSDSNGSPTSSTEEEEDEWVDPEDDDEEEDDWAGPEDDEDVWLYPENDDEDDWLDTENGVSPALIDTIPESGFESEEESGYESHENSNDFSTEANNGGTEEGFFKDSEDLNDDSDEDLDEGLNEDSSESEESSGDLLGRYSNKKNPDTLLEEESDTGEEIKVPGLAGIPSLGVSAFLNSFDDVDNGMPQRPQVGLNSIPTIPSASIDFSTPSRKVDAFNFGSDEEPTTDNEKDSDMAIFGRKNKTKNIEEDLQDFEEEEDELSDQTGIAGAFGYSSGSIEVDSEETEEGDEAEEEEDYEPTPKPSRRGNSKPKSLLRRGSKPKPEVVVYEEDSEDETEEEQEHHLDLPPEVEELRPSSEVESVKSDWLATPAFYFVTGTSIGSAANAIIDTFREGDYVVNLDGSMTIQVALENDITEGLLLGKKPMVEDGGYFFTVAPGRVSSLSSAEIRLVEKLVEDHKNNPGRRTMVLLPVQFLKYFEKPIAEMDANVVYCVEGAGFGLSSAVTDLSVNLTDDMIRGIEKNKNLAIWANYATTDSVESFLSNYIPVRHNFAANIYL